MNRNVPSENDFRSTLQAQSAPPGSPIASIATPIASSFANPVKSSSSGNSFQLPEFVPVVLDNGEGLYVPKIFIDKLSRVEAMLTETRRESELECQNEFLFTQMQREL